MTKIKPTVTIAIPVFNESKTIENIVRSLLKQKNNLFNLKEIVIVLDGCTDNTHEIAKKIKSPKIKIHNFVKRLGKSIRQNFILRNFESDYLIFIDSDIIIKDKNLINKIVQAFSKDKSLSLICPAAYPTKVNSFISKSIRSSVLLYINYFEQIEGGNNIFACKGTFMALTKKFAKSLKIPKSVYASDTYIYFSCLKLVLKFKYLKNAKVYYKLPSNLIEHIHQNTRFIGSADNIQKYFGETVKENFKKQRLIFAREMFKQFIKSPQYVVSIALINLYVNFVFFYKKDILNPLWKTVRTSKLW